MSRQEHEDLKILSFCLFNSSGVGNQFLKFFLVSTRMKHCPLVFNTCSERCAFIHTCSSLYILMFFKKNSGFECYTEINIDQDQAFDHSFDEKS